MITNRVIEEQLAQITFAPKDVYFIDTVNQRLHMKYVQVTRLSKEDNKTFLIERIKRLKVPYVTTENTFLTINGVDILTILEQDIESEENIVIETNLISDIEDMQIYGQIKTLTSNIPTKISDNPYYNEDDLGVFLTVPSSSSGYRRESIDYDISYINTLNFTITKGTETGSLGGVELYFHKGDYNQDVYYYMGDAHAHTNNSSFDGEANITHEINTTDLNSLITSHQISDIGDYTHLTLKNRRYGSYVQRTFKLKFFDDKQF